MSWFQSGDEGKSVEEHAEILGDALTEWGASVRNFVWPFMKSTALSVDSDTDEVAELPDSGKRGTAELLTAPTLSTLSSFYGASSTCTNSTLAPASTQCLSSTVTLPSNEINLRDLPCTITLSRSFEPLMQNNGDSLPDTVDDNVNDDTEAVPTSPEKRCNTLSSNLTPAGSLSSFCQRDSEAKPSQVTSDLWIDMPSACTDRIRTPSPTYCRYITTPVKLPQLSPKSEPGANHLDDLASFHSVHEDDVCERSRGSRYSASPCFHVQFGPSSMDFEGWFSHDGKSVCASRLTGSRRSSAARLTPATSSTSPISMTLRRTLSDSMLRVADEAPEDNASQVTAERCESICGSKRESIEQAVFRISQLGDNLEGRGNELCSSAIESGLKDAVAMGGAHEGEVGLSRQWVESRQWAFESSPGELSKAARSREESREELSIVVHESLELREELSKAAITAAELRGELSISVNESAELREKLSKASTMTKELRDKLSLSMNESTELRKELPVAARITEELREELSIAVNESAELREKLSKATIATAELREEISIAVNESAELREKLSKATIATTELREELSIAVNESTKLHDVLAVSGRTLAELKEAFDAKASMDEVKSELSSTKCELKRVRDELQSERIHTENWMARTEREYDALHEDLTLARKDHQRDNETHGKVIASQSVAIEWLETMRKLLNVQLELSAATQNYEATIAAQRAVKQILRSALTSTVAIPDKLSVAETISYGKRRSWLTFPATRRTLLFHEVSRSKRAIVEGAYLIKNGKIADRFLLEKHEVLDNFTLQYVNGAINPTETKHELSYDLLDDLQHPRGSQTRFFIFSLLSAVKDGSKKPCENSRPFDILYGFCLTFRFLRRTEDLGQGNAVLGTMGIVLFSRFPLLVLFRSLLHELFQCQYIQIDARLRRLLKGKKPDTMTWSDSAWQLLRIASSQCRQSTSNLIIPIPPYFGHEGGAITHLPESEKSDHLCATEMLGELLAPWSQYKSAFLDMLAAFMLERKVVIISPDIQRGSLLSVSLRALICPFVWHHVFQSCMPPSLVDELPMMDAPFPFLVHIADDVPKDCPEDVVVCSLETDGLMVANVEKDVFPPKLLAALRHAETATLFVHVFKEALRELHSTIEQWGHVEGTQPMENAKAFVKKVKLPLFRSANDEFLTNFFKTQQCCDVVDSAIYSKKMCSDRFA